MILSKFKNTYILEQTRISGKLEDEMSLDFVSFKKATQRENKGSDEIIPRNNRCIFIIPRDNRCIFSVTCMDLKLGTPSKAPLVGLLTFPN